MEASIIRAIDRTAFWEGILTSKNKWVRAKWARKTRKFLNGSKLAVHGSAFIFPESPDSDLEDMIEWLEYGFELTHAKMVTSEEAEALGPEFAWSVSTTGVGLVKCDENGNPVKRTSKITLEDFRKFVEEEACRRKYLLRDAALASWEIGGSLLGWFGWAIKVLKSSLFAI